MTVGRGMRRVGRGPVRTIGAGAARRIAAAGVGLAIGLPVLGVVGPAITSAAAAPCSDTWNNTAGGTWDTATDWSTGHVPASGDVACITAAGTYTVIVGNETITVAGLVIGGSGSTPTLQIGNSGSGEPAITVNGPVTNSGTLSDGWGGTFTATDVDNSGTFIVPASGFTSTFTITTFSNTGTFTVDAIADYSLPTTASILTNSGTLSVASSETLAVTSPSGQTGTVQQDGLIDNSGAITVADATEISGGSICGTAPLIGAADGGVGGTLSFDSSVASGPSCGTGVKTDNLFVPNVTATVTGTIPAAYTVTIGDGGSSFSHVTLSSVTNKGILSFGWGGTLTGALVNDGTFVVPSSGFTSTWDSTSIDNKATVNIDANLDLSLTTTASTLTNAGTLTVPASVTLAVTSPSGQSGTFEQKSGLVTNLGSLTVADVLDVKGGSICGDAVYSGSGDGGTGGTLEFAATPTSGPACAPGQKVNQIFVPNVTGTISTNIPQNWTVTVGDGGSSFAHVTFSGTANAGTFEPGFGATITAAGSLTNTGTLTVPASGFNTVLVLGSLTNSGTITFSGPTTVTLPSGQTFTNSSGKRLTVGKTVTVTLTGDFSNAGKLKLKSGAFLNPSGTFTQASTGVLSVQIGSSSATVRLQVAGAVTVAGTINVVNKSFTPTSGEMFTIINAPSLAGTFATVEGTYAVSYSSTSVTATAP